MSSFFSKASSLAKAGATKAATATANAANNVVTELKSHPTQVKCTTCSIALKVLFTLSYLACLFHSYLNT